MRAALLTLLALATGAILLALEFQSQPGDGQEAAVRRVPAPPLALNDVFGEPHVLAKLRGKVVLVNFWTTWCPPCIEEIPSMQRAWEQLQGQEFEILAVAMGEDHNSIRAFRNRLGTRLTFTLLPDPLNQVFRDWPMFGIPVSFLIDRQGCIAARVQGERQWDDPRALAAIRALLTEPAEPASNAAGHARCRGTPRPL